MPLALYNPKQSDTHPNHKDEKVLESAKFTVYKFNSRIKPIRKDRILIIGCFSEFGCETVGVTYAIPRLIKRFPGMYIIAMGWYGRDYLYRNLVDEFWEIDANLMNLRNYTFAFHHKSINLRHIEECASKHGTVVPTEVLGKYAVGNTCKTCGAFWNEWRKTTKNCARCGSTNIVNSLFGSAEKYRKTAKRIPFPSKDKFEWAKNVVTEPAVAIFARGRKTYGRNLTPEFYVKLIQMVRKMGYHPIWMGEKQSTQPCPVPDVFDFSRCEESRDLEKTFAIVQNCKFTIQYWTASSRIAGLMGVPFLLFESPEQIYCSGFGPAQEGRRLELTSFGEKKVCLAHYLKSVKEQDKLLYYTKEAILEMEQGIYTDMITDLVKDQEAVQILKTEYYKMVN